MSFGLLAIEDPLSLVWDLEAIRGYNVYNQ
jgi:hypothetical protein